MARTFFRGAGIARSALVSATLAFMLAPATAQTSLACHALVSANNQLYLVSRDGTVLSQFVTDGLPKTSIALSPDGTKAAYISASSLNGFTVVNLSGRSVTTSVAASSQGTLASVSWDAGSILNVRSHIARDNDVFQFYAVPENFSSTLLPVGNQAIGRVCAAKGADDYSSACIIEDRIAVHKKTLAMSDPASPENSTKLDSVTVALQSSVMTRTSPSFQLSVMGLSNGLALKITLPNGNWKQSSIAVGERISIAWDDADYSFVPVNVDSAKGLVTVDVFKNNEVGGFDPAIAWSRNNYVVAVERRKSGSQLVLVKSSGNEAPARIALNFAEPVISLTYDSPTTLMLRSQSQFGVMPVSFVNGSTASIKAGPITPLPAILAIALPNGKVKAAVQGWSCR